MSLPSRKQKRQGKVTTKCASALPAWKTSFYKPQPRHGKRKRLNPTKELEMSVNRKPKGKVNQAAAEKEHWVVKENTIRQARGTHSTTTKQMTSEPMKP